MARLLQGLAGVFATGSSNSRSYLYHRLARLLSGNARGPPAFVFDIDGVLIRGRNVLPMAVQAMKELCPNSEWLFPVCFLTNGGSVSEAHKAQQLSQWLGVPVHHQQVILSHTPMQQLATGPLGHQPVLVSGQGEVMAVAANYGFRKLLSCSQLAAALPGALPFYKGIQPPAVGQTCPVRDLGWGTEEHPLAAVLVMSDPDGTDWYQDLQLLMDVITSHGVPRREKPLPGSQPIELYFSNPDLLWAAAYPRPRFGQGAFSTALVALHKQMTGRPIPNVKWFGKPNPEPYRLAEQLLAAQAIKLGLVDTADAASIALTSTNSNSNSSNNCGCASNDSNSTKPHEHDSGLQPETSSIGTNSSTAIALEENAVYNQQKPLLADQCAGMLSAIYMVGDNPAADIRGANRAGHPWVSVLVRTGVFQGPGGNSTDDPADVVVSDVLAAVHAALHMATVKWHSMR